MTVPLAVEPRPESTIGSVPADDAPEVAAALEEHTGRLRKAVADQARLRRTPALRFEPDTVLRSAERIESILRDDDPDGPPR